MGYCERCGVDERVLWVEILARDRQLLLLESGNLLGPQLSYLDLWVLYDLAFVKVELEVLNRQGNHSTPRSSVLLP